MGNSKYNGIIRSFGMGKQIQSILMFNLLGVCPRVINIHLGTKLLKFTDHIDHTGVSNIRTVLFEGNAQHQYLCTFDLLSFFDHQFYHLIGDIDTHIVIETATGKDNLRIVPYLLCLMCQVVRVNTNAVPSDKPRTEWQEVPLGTGGFKYGFCVDAEFVEDDGKFIHKGNVNVALGVFDDLCRFCHLDARSQMGTGSND